MKEFFKRIYKIYFPDRRKYIGYFGVTEKNTSKFYAIISGVNKPLEQIYCDEIRINEFGATVLYKLWEDCSLSIIAVIPPSDRVTITSNPDSKHDLIKE